jgi:hypothetical protein
LPVERVSWDDAQTFVKKLSEKTGKNYRLPSEAEWEYASRAGSQTDFCFGNDAWTHLYEYAWFCDNSQGESHPCGEKRPNAFGLHDMYGNVWEWTADCWNCNYNGAPSDGSAWGSGDCSQRVRRGGSWDYDYYQVPGERRELMLPTSALRGALSSESRINSVGFRVVSADEAPTPIGEKFDRTIRGQVDPTPLQKTKVSALLIKQTIEVASLKSKKKWCLVGSELLNVQTGEKFLVVDKLSLNRQEIRREGCGYVFAGNSTYAYVNDWDIGTSQLN